MGMRALDEHREVYPAFDNYPARVPRFFAVQPAPTLGISLSPTRNGRKVGSASTQPESCKLATFLVRRWDKRNIIKGMSRVRRSRHTPTGKRFPMTSHIQHTECICGQPNCPLHGLCHCGCGKPAKPTKVWRPTRGLAKGQPQKWLIGHQSRANTGTLEAGHFKIEGVYCRLIPLSRGLYAIVWESDYESLIRHKWHARRTSKHPGYYAARTVRHGKTREMVYMHREILRLQPGDGIEVDHADNLATLNNARSNIRRSPRERKPLEYWSPKTQQTRG